MDMVNLPLFRLRVRARPDFNGLVTLHFLQTLARLSLLDFQPSSPPTSVTTQLLPLDGLLLPMRQVSQANPDSLGSGLLARSAFALFSPIFYKGTSKLFIQA